MRARLSRWTARARRPNAAWVWAGVVGAVVVSNAVLAERTAPTLVLAYYVLPPVWVGASLLVLLTVALGRRRRALPGALAALVLSLLMLDLQLPKAVDGDADLRLVTYNVARGGRGSEVDLAAALRDADADVACLQETNGLKPGFLTRLAARLPGYAVVPGGEVAVLTRLPVLKARVHPLPDTTRRLLEVRLDANGRPLTVVDAHFTTVLLRGDLARTRDRRESQLDALLDLAARTPDPFVACGDFNTHRAGLVYARLRGALGNAYEEAGSGFGATFPAAFPLVRIDHVWLRGARAVRARVGEGRASDHLPLAVDLRFDGP